MIADMYPNEVRIQFWVHHTCTQMQFRFSLVKCSFSAIFMYWKKDINYDEIIRYDKQIQKGRSNAAN